MLDIFKNYGKHACYSYYDGKEGRMGEYLGKTSEISLAFNILVYKEDNVYVSHCLELDIVAAGESYEQSQRDIISLICAQVEYAFVNDNLHNLYHPAPREAWDRFFSCKEQMEQRYKIENRIKTSIKKAKLLPPWLVAKTCLSDNLCHA